MNTLRIGKLPWILWVFMAIECGMGISYFGINLLANTAPMIFLLVDNLCHILHVALVDATIAIALYYFSHKHKREGFSILIFFFLALVVKEFCVSTIVDALLYLLFDGLCLALIASLAFFIFLRRQPAQDAPTTLFQRGNRLVPATLFVTSTYTLIHLVTLLIEVLDFGSTYLWLLSWGEVLAIIADFLFVFAGAILAFITAHVTMDKFELE